MAYEPTNWKSGDVVTSAKLNKIEQGIAGVSGILVATMDQDTHILNRTWQELYDSSFSVVLTRFDDPEHPSSNIGIVYCVYAEIDNDEYIVLASAFNFISDNASPYLLKFITNSPNGYPTFSPSDDPIDLNNPGDPIPAA